MAQAVKGWPSRTKENGVFLYRMQRCQHTDHLMLKPQNMRSQGEQAQELGNFPEAQQHKSLYHLTTSFSQTWSRPRPLPCPVSEDAPKVPKAVTIRT